MSSKQNNPPQISLNNILYATFYLKIWFLSSLSVTGKCARGSCSVSLFCDGCLSPHSHFPYPTLKWSGTHLTSVSAEKEVLRSIENNFLKFLAA